MMNHLHHHPLMQLSTLKVTKPPDRIAKSLPSVFFNKSVTIETNNKNERSVVNLSSYVLSEIKRPVLQKGLKFSPIPGEPDMNEILDDLTLFEKNETKSLFS